MQFPSNLLFNQFSQFQQTSINGNDFGSFSQIPPPSLINTNNCPYTAADSYQKRST